VVTGGGASPGATPSALASQRIASVSQNSPGASRESIFGSLTPDEITALNQQWTSNSAADLIAALVAVKRSDLTARDALLDAFGNDYDTGRYGL
jgi:hypothetical protein